MKKLLLALLVLIGLQTQTQAQILPCDSLEMNIEFQSLDTIALSASFGQFLPGYTQSYDWYISTCPGVVFGGSYDSIAPFNIPLNTDTLIVCLTATYCDSNLCYSCFICDTLVMNLGTGQWEFISMISNPTSIQELEINPVSDNRIYDMLGRELFEVPVGKMYIRNQKLYITR